MELDAGCKMGLALLLVRQSVSRRRDARCRIRDAKCRILNAGYGDDGCEIRDAR
jgi:hypothetical protein